MAQAGQLGPEQVFLFGKTEKSTRSIPDQSELAWTEAQSYEPSG